MHIRYWHRPFPSAWGWMVLSMNLVNLRIEAGFAKRCCLPTVTKRSRFIWLRIGCFSWRFTCVLRSDWKGGLGVLLRWKISQIKQRSLTWRNGWSSEASVGDASMFAENRRLQPNVVSGFVFSQVACNLFRAHRTSEVMNLMDSPRGFQTGGTLSSIEDGARYRVRTCDPYHVKVMLYH